MMRSLFFVIYLTDTVGLDPRLASYGAIIGLIWDAINDPLVGMFSDRVQTRWGRRRPFLLIFAIPFGASFVAMWSAPHWDSQIALIVYVTLAFMLVDTFGTLTIVPYLSLTPELTQEYDERTALSGFRTAFQLIGSFSVVLTAPMLVDRAVESGLTQQHGYLSAGVVFGSLAAFFYLGVFLFIREKKNVREKPKNISILKLLRIAWSNIPFRFVMAIFLLNWTALDMVAVVFPFYLLYWMANGDLVAKVRLFGLSLALESAFFGLLMLICIISVPFWLWFSRQRNKRDSYVVGMIFLVVILLLIFFVQPDQMSLLLVLGALAGFGVSAAYVLPDAMFPDIIEWDELRTRRRQEGIYYGARNFIRRVTMAVVIFLTLQLLGWTGYQTPPPDAVAFVQPPGALLTIRILVSLVSVVMLSGAALMTWFNPMTREKNVRIQKLIERRKARIVLID